jgi:hypothetical protein
MKMNFNGRETRQNARGTGCSGRGVCGQETAETENQLKDQTNN